MIEKMDESKKIVIISDGTGKTAKRLMDAVLYQYCDQQVKFSLVGTYKEVRERKQLDKVLKEIEDHYLVIISIISDDLKSYAHEVLEERKILHLNVLEPMLNTMSKFLGVHPDYKPGILQIIDDRYYRKVDAIGFTVEHDDGMGKFISEADVILLGLSRTCKTPISVYLACNIGLKAANIPIIPNPHARDQITARLAPINHNVIYGLLLQPEVLVKVREERARVLSGGASHEAFLKTYFDINEIRHELRFCRELYQDLGCEIIDVTRRAIEEIAYDITNRLKRKGLVD